MFRWFSYPNRARANRLQYIGRTGSARMFHHLGRFGVEAIDSGRITTPAFVYVREDQLLPVERAMMPAEVNEEN